MTHTKTPDKGWLRRQLDAGLTQAEMVDAWERESNYRVSRSAIAMTLHRHNLKGKRSWERFEDLIPWTVKPEHKNTTDARMLRLEARRRRGKPIRNQDLASLTKWLDNLREQNAVIHYEPDTHKGFWWVPRTSEDTDIIRN